MSFLDPLSNEYPEFIFPDTLIRQCNEASNGGVLVFYIDNYGNVQRKALFDSPIVEVAIREKALEFLTSVKRMNQMVSDQSLMEQVDFLSDESDEEEEE